MKIIARYITKEILLTFFTITSILLLIVISNRFALYLAKAATGELPISLVFKIVGLYTPEFLSYLIPLSFFVAILFAYGRMYADSEMTVLSACGLSSNYIIRLTLTLALIVLLFTGALTVWIVPEVASLREKALHEGEAFGVMQSLMPGRFQTFSDGGRLVFYIEETTQKKGSLKGIFIAERPNNAAAKPDQGWTVITAEEAHVAADEENHRYNLVLQKGERYQGLPGKADYSVVKFQEYGREIPHQTETVANDALRLKKTMSLMSSKDPEDAAELQWRLSLPLSILILALVAIPLAKVNPRHGRFARFLPAIVVYIVYYNLFTISKRWVTNEVLPQFIGVWWVHILFLSLGLFLIAKESGWLRRMKSI